MCHPRFILWRFTSPRAFDSLVGLLVCLALGLCAIFDLPLCLRVLPVMHYFRWLAGLAGLSSIRRGWLIYGCSGLGIRRLLLLWCIAGPYNSLAWSLSSRSWNRPETLRTTLCFSYTVYLFC